MEKIVSLSKRRGFIFQSSEIYGGLNGCWDYGPLGVELLRNIKDQWWQSMTYRDDIEGIDASILMHPRVWEASGHVENFTDPMVDCKQCKARYRVDVLFESLSDKTISKLADSLTALLGTELPESLRQVLEEETIREMKGIPNYPYTLDERVQFKRDNFVEMRKFYERQGRLRDWLMSPGRFNALVETAEIPCPNCGNKGTFTPARKFNLMFKTFVGPVEDSSAVVYLRPETAQGIYVNFLNVQLASRQKLPFGIAQVGKAFRNEINTKNFLFRTREFEQMEMQYFVKPGTDLRWFEYWKEERMNWFLRLGMTKEKLRWNRHEPEKLAHYAKDAFDIEYQFSFGWGEIEGIHNRTDYDLSRHEEYSGKSMKYFDEETKERYTPYIIETSAGASRAFMAFLVDAYREEDAPTADGKMDTRAVLRLHPKIAPTKVAVFPLVNRDGMQEVARKIEVALRPHLRVFYDESGAVGRRYRRQDEAGTPYCVTVDSQTLQDQTVTIRDRDTMRQERLGIESILAYLQNKIFVS